jgi:hypothetical protein
MPCINKNGRHRWLIELWYAKREPGVKPWLSRCVSSRYCKAGTVEGAVNVEFWSRVMHSPKSCIVVDQDTSQAKSSQPWCWLLARMVTTEAWCTLSMAMEDDGIERYYLSQAREKMSQSIVWEGRVGSRGWLKIVLLHGIVTKAHVWTLLVDTDRLKWKKRCVKARSWSTKACKIIFVNAYAWGI